MFSSLQLNIPPTTKLIKIIVLPETENTAKCTRIILKNNFDAMKEHRKEAVISTTKMQSLLTGIALELCIFPLEKRTKQFVRRLF